MRSDRVRVLVTAIGGGGHGEQILKALRLADQNSYYIIGADAQANCPQFDWVEEKVILPLASDSSYIDVLLENCDRLRVQALFHGCEPELKKFSSNRSRIREKGIFLPINPTKLINTCMSKEETNRTLTSLGFDSPKFAQVSSRNDLKNIDWFPVVVKPSVGGGGSANVYVAQNTHELLALADYLSLELIADNFLIQEYVGTPEDEYTVGILHDMDGNYINSIAVRRLFSGQLNIRMSVPNRTNRAELGNKLVISSGVSHGYVGRFPKVTEQCKEIAKAIGSKGPINIQCRLVNGIVKVFEINPRFSGTTSIRAMVGYNEPDILVKRHILNEDVKVDFPYEEALVLRSLVETKI